MPASFSGVLLFVILLAPGLAFLVARDANIPSREVSPFRETSTAALIGLACDAVVVCLYGLLRWMLPERTIDVGALLAAPAEYLRLELPRLALTVALALAFACAIGVVVAERLPTNWGRISRASAWHQMFRDRTGIIAVGCELDDGGYVSGHLFSYAEDTAETADRELVLTGPLEYRTSGGKTVLLGSSGVIVSARRIKFLEVSYLRAASDAAAAESG